MSLKKPTPIISPLQNDEKEGGPGSPPKMQASFYRSENRNALGLIVYGILSFVGAGFCISSADPEINMASLPCGAFGIAFIWLGILVIQQIGTDSLHAHKADSGESYQRENTSRIQKLIDIFRRLRVGSAIVLATGICGILIACLIEAMTYSIGLWLALVIQAGIFSVVVLLMTFRLEIHLHEISRHRGDAT